jgi:hypothetical protein
MILVLCLAGGIAFAGIAAWLTTKKGNTISDVLKSQNLKDAEAIKVEILDKIKLRSNLPIVGLYLIAAVVALGLPAYTLYLNRSGDPSITVQGTFENKKRNDSILIVPTDMRVEPSGVFTIPLLFRSGTQKVNIESQRYEPITLSIKMNRDENSVTVSFSNEKLAPEKIPVDESTRVVEIKQKMPLFESSAGQLAPVVNAPSPAPGGPGSHVVSIIATEAAGTAAMLPLSGGNK